MPRLRYQINETEPDGDGARNFNVLDLKDIDVYSKKPKSYYVGVTNYDWSTNTPACYHCQTPLRGMSGSCVHAQAVRRFLKKEKDAAELAEINKEVNELFGGQKI